MEVRDVKSAGTRGEMAALAGCVFANVVDGFDVLAIAFSGSAIIADWGISDAALGAIFSAGLAGMMLGSLFISPFADRYGRRTVALSCMAVMTIGMFAAGLSNSPTQLIIARLFTGLGIGGVLATLNTVVGEVSRPRRRNTVMAVFSAGYPVGSIMGGVLAIGLIADYGWRVVFLAGGVLTAAVLIVNIFTLPESSQPSGRSMLFSRAFFAKLFGAGRRGSTIGFCLAFFLQMLTFFFVLNWTPRLVEQRGFSAEIGNSVTVVLNVGSLLGPLIFGALADKLGLFRIGKFYFLLFAASVVMLGVVPANLTSLYAVAIVAGLAMAGAMTSLYAAAPVLFPGQVRAAGTGLAIGIGRLGATIGPSLAGWAIASGVGLVPLHLGFAVPLLLVFFILMSGLISANAGAVDANGELQ